MQQYASIPLTDTLTLTTADTEYSYTFDAGISQFDMQSRNTADIRISSTSGIVATAVSTTSDCVTMKGNTSYSSPPMWASANQTLYFASSTAGTIIELWLWK